MVGNVLEKKIVIDSKRNIWLFYPGVSGKTGYIMKNSRGESVTGQLIMDEIVTEYDIIVDEGDSIHIIALTMGQKVVYSRHDERGWTKHTLYSFDGKPVSIFDVKVVKDTGGLHLFYMYSEKGGDCALFHHQWTGDEWRGYRVFDMAGMNGGINYDAGIGRNNRLDIVAVRGKVLSLWEFDGTGWTLSVTKDDGLWERASYVEFREGCIMLKSHKGVYFIKNIHQTEEGDLQEIVDGRHVEEGPVLIDRRNTLYIAWIEGGSLGYRASYDGGSSWGRVKYYYHIRNKELEVYGFASTYSLLIDAKRIIATVPPEVHIPFLHRSVERVSLPMAPLIEGTEDVEGDCDLQRYGETSMDSSLKVNAKDYGHSPGKGDETRDWDMDKYELERIKAELNALRQRLEADVQGRLDRLDLEVTDLKKSLKGSAEVGTSMASAGSIITQDMLNKYIRKK